VLVIGRGDEHLGRGDEHLGRGGRGNEHLGRGGRGNEHLGRGGRGVRGDEQISLDFRNNHPHARFQERIVEKWVGWLAKDLALK